MSARFGFRELVGYLGFTPPGSGPQEERARAAMRDYLTARADELGNRSGDHLTATLWQERERFAAEVAGGTEVSQRDRDAVTNVVNESVRAAGRHGLEPLNGWELRAYVQGLRDRAVRDRGDEHVALSWAALRLNRTDVGVGNSADMLTALRDRPAGTEDGMTVGQRQAMTAVVDHLRGVRVDPGPMRDSRGQDVLDYARQRLERAGTGDERAAIGRAVELMEQRPGLMGATDLVLREHLLDQPLDAAAVGGLTTPQADRLHAFLGELAATTDNPAIVTSRTTGTEALRAEVRRAQGAPGPGVAAGAEQAAVVAKFVDTPAGTDGQSGTVLADGAQESRHRGAVRSPGGVARTQG